MFCFVDALILSVSITIAFLKHNLSCNFTHLYTILILGLFTSEGSSHFASLQLHIYKKKINNKIKILPSLATK
jgi:hypothetical protein